MRYKHKSADFPRALKRILSNKLLVTNIMSSTFYILGASGYITYSTKYMEVQYNKSAAGASMLAGGSQIKIRLWQRFAIFVLNKGVKYFQSEIF